MQNITGKIGMAGVRYVDSEELIDIRNGADGVTYTSAGESVRTQFSNLKDDLDDQIDDVSERIRLTNVDVGSLKTSNIENTRDHGYIGITTNLLNVKTNSSVTKNGVTLLKVNAVNGAIALNGTATSDTYFELGTVKLSRNALYKIVGRNNAKKDECAMCIEDSSGSQVVFESDNNGVMITQYTDYIVRIKVTSGTTCNNLVFKPIVTTNVSATLSDFVPYTGSTGHLNSDIANVRKDVDMIGNVTNLLHSTLKGSTTINGLTVTENNGTYTVNGTASANTDVEISELQTLDAGNYKLMGCPSNGGSTTYYLRCVSENNTIYATDNGICASFTFNSAFSFKTLIHIQSGQVCSNLVFKPMISTNTSATYDDYIPYTGVTGHLNTDVAAIRSDADEIDEEVSKLKEAIVELTNNAGCHNGIFRGKDLTNVYTKDQIYAMINAGTFDDLFIGDYFDVTINGEGGNETVRCVLAGFDTYLHNGATDFSRHHAVIVTKNCLNTLHQMNPTNTAEGGFVGSDMWQNTIHFYNTAFEGVFGSHLLSHRTILTNAMTSTLASNAGSGFTGATSGWAWTDTKLSLLSEIQVYGANVFSSSFYDTGCDNLQLPLFALDPTAKVCGKGGTGTGRQWYWLRNVASATRFAYVGTDGVSNADGASGSAGVRPLFCIG